MENKLVSVVITTYKRDFCILKEAIDSVLTAFSEDKNLLVALMPVRLWGDKNVCISFSK